MSMFFGWFADNFADLADTISGISFTFRRYNNDGIVSTNGRLYSLLSLVGLEERLLKADEDVEKCMLMQIDYIKIHRKLETLREFTKQYIKEALFQSGINYDNY